MIELTNMETIVVAGGSSRCCCTKDPQGCSSYKQTFPKRILEGIYTKQACVDACNNIGFPLSTYDNGSAADELFRQDTVGALVVLGFIGVGFLYYRNRHIPQRRR